MAHEFNDNHAYVLSCSSGAQVVASCGPLSAIVAGVLANQPDKHVLRQICTFLATDNGFIPAIRSCEIKLPVKFGPPATAKAAASFGGWLAKCGCIVSTLELNLLPTSYRPKSSLCLSTRRAAEQVIAAALQMASAQGAAAGSSSSGLQIPACKLTGVGLGSADILQALPGSTLTSLELEVDLPDVASADAARAMTVELGTALQRLQQLHTLKLDSEYLNGQDIGFDAALPGFGGFSNLTRLELLSVQSGELLQHLPTSLVELEVQLPPLNEGPLLLGHLTGLTTLTAGQYNTLRKDHMLPPSLRQLTAGNAEAANCLLPLTQLQQLTLQAIDCDIMPAADMQQLTSLHALTDVELVYWASAAAIDTAAAGWRALPLTHLYLSPGNKSESLFRSTLLQLTSLTNLGTLDLARCGLDDIEPDELAEVLTQLNSLYKLSLHAVCWQQQQQGQIAAADDAGSSPLAKFLQGLAARMPNGHIIHICLNELHVGRAEAAALAGMSGLQELVLHKCQLEDCSVAEIALNLKPWLVELHLSWNPKVTDACLPVLAHAGISMKASDFNGTGVTREGLKRYMPDSLDA